ncbi:uncharacterized protein LOC129581599 [Paramacrobiotus metropolitanus]|uniref:uncharacterized protein LOC129581599 n=1 Tax=Paramacrobiotus metropolitanus TaxID=2943436 RepID=UPI0024458820|nr:uncharacterized protein LOC129581599 [Paramacrobiotus metropolitanus]XP_055328755.1 uncharacterized protein LOC129581599 [Paramacrobiotus metropolitanus]XP_055328756.1 uncharacterized protein LOC129581599 [Paramacrobiotus metropolitanus]XP_055328757.1 uncharacterized protein LOC129581599 [Paramacrobiotus metropolitanus]XP_055328758.1 uncharacterized protein LOC129581599 [Paramacrobiotus metropolitanus]
MEQFYLTAVTIGVYIVGSSWILPCHGCTSCLDIPPLCRDLQISASASCVDVPCSYSLTRVEGVDLTLWNGCGNATSRNYIATDLLYSSKAGTPQLITVDPTNGLIYRNSLAATEDVTQVYQFTYFNFDLSLSVSSSANVTFNFASCAIKLIGPANGTTYCPAIPPDTINSIYYDYPQLTFTASNVPDGTALIWDAPVDCNCPVNGLGAPLADVQAGMYSPAVLDYGANPGVILVSNYNAVLNFPATSKTGIYGASNYGGEINYSGCQTLRFSVMPVSSSPYLTGSVVIEVCFDPAGAACYII